MTNQVQISQSFFPTEIATHPKRHDQQTLNKSIFATSQPLCYKLRWSKYQFRSFLYNPTYESGTDGTHCDIQTLLFNPSCQAISMYMTMQGLHLVQAMNMKDYSSQHCHRIRIHPFSAFSCSLTSVVAVISDEQFTSLLVIAADQLDVKRGRGQIFSNPLLTTAAKICLCVWRRFRP